MINVLIGSERVESLSTIVLSARYYCARRSLSEGFCKRNIHMVGLYEYHNFYQRPDLEKTNKQTNRDVDSRGISLPIFGFSEQGRSKFYSLTLSRQEWSISDFPCSLTRNITSHSMKDLAFYGLLRCKMIILLILNYLTLYISLQKVGKTLFRRAFMNPLKVHSFDLFLSFLSL